MRKTFLLAVLFTYIGTLLLSLLWIHFLWLFVLWIPMLLFGTYDMFQSKHTIRRNFPLFGRARWGMEFLRPFIRQYFIESASDGAPINRIFRSVVYQRAKGALDTVPYGTRFDTYRIGYEWLAHSMSATLPHPSQLNPRVTVGGPDCKQPYQSSILNTSAMSFGALSREAILALNRGAKEGDFAHNTGEGGLSPYHLQYGGDIIWQIGTGYFGCRNKEGNFCANTFQERAILDSVRMIEIKISQGAKPGHGGILPAVKNSEEIAAIRHVEPHTTVYSPPRHTAFDTPIEMMHFIQQLRELSGGKPVGFKFTMGRPSEFIGICKAMIETGIKPDFITVDGGEGGTGAAPLEYSNSIGMPLRPALAIVCDCLTGFDLKKDIKVIASGKIFTGFHLVKNFALGADICASARGMMLALGCVHSLICNTNRCPTGVTTQDKELRNGLVVADKYKRVANFHRATVKATMDMISSAGLQFTSELNRTHIYRRTTHASIERYDQIFPYVSTGALLSPPFPEMFEQHMTEASSEHFLPNSYIAHHHEGVKAVG